MVWKISNIPIAMSTLKRYNVCDDVIIFLVFVNEGVFCMPNNSVKQSVNSEIVSTQKTDVKEAKASISDTQKVEESVTVKSAVVTEQSKAEQPKEQPQTDTSTCQVSEDIKQELGEGSSESTDKDSQLTTSSNDTLTTDDMQPIDTSDTSDQVLTSTEKDNSEQDNSKQSNSVKKEPVKNERIKDERPDDLITAQQAAQMSGKSKNTIRAWVRQEKLTGYRQNPQKSNSALMISQTELMVFLATEATPTPTESRVGRPEVESASIAKLRLENQELQAKVTALEQEKEFLRQMLDHQKELIVELQNSRNMLTEQSKLSRLDLEREVDKTERLQMRIERLTTYFALPFWKRWNSSILELENKS